MTTRSNPRACVLTLFLFLAVSSGGFGQGTTTGNLTGVVTAEVDASALPGSTVTAVHEPTGTRYEAVTRQDGRFSILNVRVGGPYRVSVAMQGFEAIEKRDFDVRLGEDLNLSFSLRIEAFEEEISVSATTPIINPVRTGVTANVTGDAIEVLPTLSRSFFDFARTSVYFTPGAANDGLTDISVAGRNNRYNNLQIDGAINNDLFGLSATGTPGGQAETEPISLEAIQELQLLVSPYDVRQGGFSGGGINAITKNGTNQFHGTLFYYSLGDSMVGDGLDDIPIAEFEQTQYGFSLGGRLVADRSFFFVAGEVNRRDQPSGYSIGGGGQDFGHDGEAQRFRDILIETYGYDPGGFDEFIRATDNDNVFARFDFNLGQRHQLTFRHNWVDASNDRGFPSSRFYIMPDAYYQFTGRTNSSVLQLNSTLGDAKFNEARLTYQIIDDRRTGPTRFPSVGVRLVDGDVLLAGRDRGSAANALDQTILEISDDLTFVRGDHTVNVGTHNEILSFDNLFLVDNFGAYGFDSPDDLERGWARRYTRSFSATDDPLESAKFDVYQIGVYGGDQWAVSPRLTLTYGLRLDAPFFPDEPTRNQEVEEPLGYRTDVVPDGNLLWSPRLGFNWDITGDSKQQLRGGTGIFGGRTPYVWLSNQYSNTGIEFTRLSLFLPFRQEITADNHIPFEPDPDNQPTEIGFAATNEINLSDPDFESPQILRTSLAYDRNLGFWGLIASAELIYSTTLKDIDYQNLNIQPSGETLFDGRPLMQPVVPQFREVILLTNTNQGNQWSTSLKLERPFRNGIHASAAYLYGSADSIIDATSSQASSNWRRLKVVDPTDPDLATSDFDVGHRFVAVFAYEFKLGPLGSNLAVYYNAQSGRPYSTSFSTDVNGDFVANDLMYVPATADEVVVVGGTWEDLNAYIEADDGLRTHRGEIVPRNASRAPWQHTFDLQMALRLPIKKVTSTLTLDLMNLANLVDSNSGLVLYAPNNAVSPVRYRGTDPTSGLPIYELEFSDPDERFDRDDLRSRWRARVGLRFSL